MMLKGVEIIFKNIKIFFIFITVATLFLIFSGFNYIYSDSLNSYDKTYYLVEDETVSEINKNTIEGQSEINAVNEKFHSVLSFSESYNDFFDTNLNGIEKNLRAFNSLPLKVKESIYESVREKEIDTKDILFIGNSLIEGISLYSNSDSSFLSKVGISLDGLKNNIYNKIENYDCNVVIIGMGTNELGGYSEESFKISYNDLIDKVLSVNSNAEIYCLSVPPVSQNKSNNSTSFNNINVKRYSGYIKDICEDRSLKYIDCSEFFGDVLKSNWTGDGIHLAAKIYVEWYNWILTKL